MKGKQCVIIGAGEFVENNWKMMETIGGNFKSDYIGQHKKPLYIAADGGYFVYKMKGMIPDIWIGDFDSYHRGDNDVTKELVELSKEKDDTDMLAAIRIGFEKGCTEFHILGGTGKRVEHMLANLQCLQFIRNKNAHGYMYGDNRVFTIIKNESYLLKKNENKYVSIFSVSKKTKGVTLKGFKYPLMNATIKNDFPIGISNELVSEIGEICVKHGELLLVF